MSGDFDPDKLIEERRNLTNLFGIVYDPITKQKVRFPYIHTPTKRNEQDTKKKQDAKRNTAVIKKQNAKKNINCPSCEKRDVCKLVEQGFPELCPKKSNNSK